MYVTIRVLHIVCGALWFGFAVFSAWFLVPLAADLGPDMAKINQGLQRRGFIVATPVIAGLAILSGFWLYGQKVGYSAESAHTHAAIAIQAGAGFAILSFLVGALLIGRSMRKAATLAGQAAHASDADRARLLQQSAALRDRGAAAGKVVAVFLFLTVVLMSAAFYLP